MQKLLFFFILSLSWAGNLPQEDNIAAPQEIRYDESVREPLQFDEAYTEDLKKQSDFNYVEIEAYENWWTKFKKWLNNIWQSIWNALFGGIEAGPFWAFILNLLPWIVIGLLFGLILWLFIRMDPGGSLMKQKNTANVFLSEDEKIIQSRDINQLIDQAKQNNNYRLAVRYYYLLILKNLADKNIISYQFEKTNEDYLREIENLGWQQKFKVLTHIYDFIWYGNFGITATDFSKAEKQFLNLQADLKNSGNE